MSNKWDLISYSNDDLSISLKWGEKTALYCYPWSKPIRKQFEIDADARCEEINVPEDQLHLKMCARVRLHAIEQLSTMAMATLNGGYAKTQSELHTAALKFIARRLASNLINGKQFVSMIRSASILQPIPESFWSHIGPKISTKNLQKIKETAEVLSVFHRNDKLVSEEMVAYVSRILWFQDQFKVCSGGARQMALLESNDELKSAFSDIAAKAEGVIQKQEIEAEASKLKPWQRSVAPRLKQGVRSIPGAKSRRHGEEKRAADTEGDGKAGEQD